ncbi:hypothetical protein JHK87_043217 [Glycine soja]|nr:hypothetical protein JHK87_043217 [Glycine soja]
MLRIFVPLQESPPSTVEELTLLLTPRTYYHQLRNVAIERRIARLEEVEGQQIRNTNLASNRLVSEPFEPASASAVKSSKSVGVKLRTPFVSKTEEYNIWKRRWREIPFVQDNAFIISNPKSKYIVLQLDLSRYLYHIPLKSGIIHHSNLQVMTGYLLAGSIIEPGDAYVQGGMVGDLSYMKLEFIQSFLAGVAASDALTSALRLITKATFENSKDVLCKGAIV